MPLALQTDLVVCTIEYRADLFDDDTISRMIGDYRQLLEAVTSDPDFMISSLPVRLKPDADLRPVSGDRATTVYEPPNFPSELRIIKEWEDILGKRPIGLDDDIFELGASSLTVARLSERLRGLFDVDVPLAAMFQARTVRRIAGLVRNGGVGSAGSALAPIQPDGTFPPLFLCEGIGVYYPLIRHLDKEQPVYALVTEIARNYPRVEDLAAFQIIADQDRLRHLLSATADRYKLSPYPGRITLFVLAERDGMSDSLFDPAIGVIDPRLGWGRLPPGKVDVYEVAGEHTGIFLEPNVQRMAEKLAACLERARAEFAN